MDDPRSQPQSRLFTLRVWQTDSGEGQSEWRGKLQFVESGEIRYFRDWPALIRYLDEMLAVPTNDGQTSLTGNELQTGGQV
jgi:hypothetical protein